MCKISKFLFVLVTLVRRQQREQPSLGRAQPHEQLPWSRARPVTRAFLCTASRDFDAQASKNVA